MKWPFLLLSAVVVVAGCAQRGPKNLSLCTKEAGITGQYSTVYTIGDGVAVVPGPNVSPEQARAANACLTRPASQQQSLFGARKSSSVPSEYPLQPGDAALWQSLTAEQQLRALEFLRDGSTIRSSLKPD